MSHMTALHESHDCESSTELFTCYSMIKDAVGGIEPVSSHPSSPPPLPAAEPSPSPRPTSPYSVQERDFEVADYYDIMIVGITGQGKSTTADELIIASGPNQISSPEISGATKMTKMR